MINTDPFNRLLAERNLSITQLFQLSGLYPGEIKSFLDGTSITKHKVEVLCSFLKCQPCDLIEFSKTETRGHWEWIEEKKC